MKKTKLDVINTLDKKSKKEKISKKELEEIKKGSLGEKMQSGFSTRMENYKLLHELGKIIGQPL